MKNSVLSLVFMGASLFCFGQDECAVYKEVVDEYVLRLRQSNVNRGDRTTIVVLPQPSYHNTTVVGDYEKFKDKYGRLSKETFFDYVKKSEQSVSFEKINLPDIEFVVLNIDSIPKRDELSARYPHWINSIVELSNVGLNNAKSQALLYYSFTSGPGVGGGVYIVYEKKRKKWKRKAVIPAWAA